jgi:small GTP-binding protein
MSKEIDYNYLYKCVIVGDGGVGKSTMLQRLITEEFMPMKMTIGSDFENYAVEVEGSVVQLQIWDFSGQKRFQFFLPNYCNGASGVLLCYDITRYATLKNIQKWYDLTEKNTDDPIFILIGEKNDLEHKRSVPKDSGEEMKEKLNLDYFFETSSKSGENNKLIFKTLAKAILEKKVDSDY